MEYESSSTFNLSPERDAASYILIHYVFKIRFNTTSICAQVFQVVSSLQGLKLGWGRM
jgi:hypothetical protein